MSSSKFSKNQCQIYFHDDLNDFLPVSEKNKEIIHSFFLFPSVKDIIESLNVPHVEVDLIQVNGNYCDFSCKINNGDRVDVFPGSYMTAEKKNMVNENFHLLPDKQEIVCFILDVHLGKLARNLRLFGFDSLYRNDYRDEEIISISEKTGRIVLTQDICMLKNFRIKYGYYPRSIDHREQLREILNRFQLVKKIQMFTKCTVCNASIYPVTKESILDKLEPNTIKYFTEFYQCRNCGKTYWKGSHYDRMKEWSKEYDCFF